jgi:hypothetical protein
MNQYKPEYVDIRLNRDSKGDSDKWRVNIAGHDELHVGKVDMNCAGETIEKEVEGERKYCIRFYPTLVTYNPTESIITLI